MAESSTLVPKSDVSPKDATCRLCHQPLALETCKVDADGQPVHEECYLASLNSPESNS
jgi:hypothetical protein